MRGRARTADLVAREQFRAELAREVERAERRLARARTRYAVFTRLAPREAGRKLADL